MVGAAHLLFAVHRLWSVICLIFRRHVRRLFHLFFEILRTFCRATGLGDVFLAVLRVLASNGRYHVTGVVAP